MPVPPRPAARVPVQVEVKVWVSPDAVMVRPMLVSDEVAKVCVAPVWYCPTGPSEVIPPPAPASAPQTKRPVAELQRSLSDEPEQDERPAPVKVPTTLMLVEVAPFATRLVVEAKVAKKLVDVASVVSVFVNVAFVAKRLVDVALVVVPLMTERLKMVDDAFEMRP